MTLLLDHPCHRPHNAPAMDPAAIPVNWIGDPHLVAGLDHDLTTHNAHLGVHGPLPRPDRAQLLASIDQVDLVGRGGAAYPVAAKIRALRAGTPLVVVNGTEGEPASAKDHALLARAPHLVLDGAALLAAAVNADHVIVAVTDPHLVRVLAAAINTRPDGGHFRVQQVAQRFLAGEAHALISTLNGGNGLPPGRTVHATNRGIGGAPTLLFNAETYAQLAVLTRTGPQHYAATGIPGSPGTTLLTISGAVTHPGVLEVPAGVELGQVLRAAGAAPAQAVVIGGYHGAWQTPNPAQTLSVDALAAAGGTLGAGVVAVLGHDTCPLAELAAVATWLAGESTKQCGPCAFGLPALAGNLTALLAGRNLTGPLLHTLHRHTQDITGRGACAHPDGAARFITTALNVLTDDITAHHTHGTCRRPNQQHLALTRTAALTPQPGR